MPQLGVGIVPGGAVGAELQALTRRAFVPRLVVQIYKATPLLSLLLRNAQRAKGGVSQVTVPVQGGSYVQYSWSDYSGIFPQPQVLTASQNAEFNLKLGVVPIPFMGMEALIQSSEAVVPILKARMADAKTVAVQSISSSVLASQNNQLIPGQQQVDNLYEATDDGTFVSSYGGINRTTAGNTFWQGQLVQLGSSGAILTRSAMIRYLVQASTGTSTANTSNPGYKASLGGGGEAPDFMVMNPGDWTTLMQDFITVERYDTTPGSRYGRDDLVNSGFRGLMLGDTPIFMDPFCPKGTAYLLNSRYLALYMSEDAPFAFSGFYSAIPNLQIANIGVLIVAFNLVCSKPAAQMQLQGITGGAF
jgi:hypothetical protein